MAGVGLATFFEVGAQEPAERDSPAADLSAPESTGSSPPAASNEADEYYRLYMMLADAIAQVEANYVKPIEREKIFAAAVRGVMRELDPYSNYIEADDFENFRDEVESEFGGLGMQVTLDEAERLIVISPLVGTPAYRAGIRAGDRIEEINGKSTEGLSLQDAVNLLKGQSGTTVNVTIRRRAVEDPMELNIVRERIHVETVVGFMRNGDHRWEFMTSDDPKIGYVRITAFSRDTPTELKRALTKLKAAGMQGLVLDLRFNPGGLLTSAVDVADLFVSEGLIVATDGRNIERKEWLAKSRDTLTDVPLVVLVNRFSASASEVVAACLQDHGRAVIVGERTWGKGSVQNVVELEGGQGALKLTTASYHRPSGKNIHRFADATDEDDWGVRPDDGFALRYSFSELSRLDESFRTKDVIQHDGGDGEQSAEADVETDDAPSSNGSEFVDRQLERALEHLREQVAAGVAAEKKAG
jgi:carboxyl-terminal processing protease